MTATQMTNAKPEIDLTLRLVYTRHDGMGAIHLRKLLKATLRMWGFRAEYVPATRGHETSCANQAPAPTDRMGQPQAD